jgi:hypothetical protein
MYTLQLLLKMVHILVVQVLQSGCQAAAFGFVDNSNTSTLNNRMKMAHLAFNILLLAMILTALI